jgi:hypothetical protein
VLVKESIRVPDYVERKAMVAGFDILVLRTKNDYFPNPRPFDLLMAFNECPQMRTTDRTSGKPAELHVQIARSTIRDTNPRATQTRRRYEGEPLTSPDPLPFHPFAGLHPRTGQTRLLSAREEFVHSGTQKLTCRRLAIPSDTIFLGLGATPLIAFRIVVTFRTLGHLIRVGLRLCAPPNANDHRPRMRTPEKPDDRTALVSSGASLLLATIEAVCVFVVSANGVAALVGSSGIVLVEGARIFHEARIRLPLLALATVIALLNLWMLFNTWRLRRSGAAQWRIRPLGTPERRRMMVVAAMSVITLLFVALELFLHHRLHGSAFAYTIRTHFSSRS